MFEVREEGVDEREDLGWSSFADDLQSDIFDRPGLLGILYCLYRETVDFVSDSSSLGDGFEDDLPDPWIFVMQEFHDEL